jgi:glutathione S-transferase
LAAEPALRRDLERIDALWCEQLAASGGPFLFGEFGAVDAYYAPVAMRLRSYALPVSEAAQAYAQRLAASSGVSAWIVDALAEHDFIVEDEPYRSSR